MNQNKLIRYAFKVSLFMLAISGFAQMPIFKRYYIADIPGFGWLAAFYTTHLIHYLSAAMFIFFVVYFTLMYVVDGKRPSRLLTIKGGMYFSIIFTGFLLVIKNHQGYWFSAFFIAMADIVHLGSVILLFVFWLVCLIINKYEKNYGGCKR